MIFLMDMEEIFQERDGDTLGLVKRTSMKVYFE